MTGAWRQVIGLMATLAALAGCSLPATGQPAPSQGSRAGRAGTLTIHVLDVGQGDAILVRSPEGRTALIDAGTSSVVVDRIREQGVDTIDLVAVSHHHTDHYGGMDEVIREFRPKYFLASGTAHVTPMFVKLLRLVRDDQMIAIQPTRQPRRIELGSATLTVLPQPPEDEKEENNNSIGIRLEYGHFAMLLTGDSEETARAFWVEQCPDLVGETNVLKLAHHGSRNGTDARWLERIRPELAVCSCGEGNDYGHPHSETLQLLQQHKVPLKRTDLVGTITITSDGQTWRLAGTKPAAVAEGSAPAPRPRRDPSVRMTADATDASSTRKGWRRR